MDNAELLRMIRRLNADTWLLLAGFCVLAFAHLHEVARRGADETFLSARLAQLEQWRQTAETVREARTAQEPSDAVPAVKRSARKAGA